LNCDKQTVNDKSTHWILTWKQCWQE